MVEFALVFVFLFTIVTLVAEGGLLFATWLAATNGAREGARFAAPCLNRSIQSCTLPDIDPVVRAYTSGFLDQSPGRFSIASEASGGTVTVTVMASLSSVTPILGDLTVYGKSTMRLEHQ